MAPDLASDGPEGQDHGTPTDAESAGSQAWLLTFDYFRRHRAHMRTLQDRFDLAPMDMHALRALLPGVATPIGTLAAKIYCDPPNIPKVVRRLTDRRLIERCSDPHDRRVRAVRLTPEGQLVRDRLNQAFTDPPPMIQALTPTQQDALRDLLADMIAATDEQARPRRRAARAERGTSGDPRRSTAARGQPAGS